ncbi:hypothetical protein KCV87_28440 [Actinosynnema pretiosum subsp. pretiosum]|uniref:Uncharacterized protein n=3 Tax=Actinosynnema TaxID=40566 RepID=C6WA34_ACTMD|nr:MULTISPECIES: hypothetical protein [Actinosynnema]ACU39223.1 hypothetical protein Amir_5404 [Actinosynnema mirum DSM 43827]ATE56460.1 hypothetical protein CNX65_26910 [Actinosynnema pretiosum]AXX32824.1 hypothetical protein APASM_5459 [Actinosynnema pretiosum subsp. pretiosum]QUF03303.1 hypothetical protein KCV87_28440 [Actinosynnema pretiosum subsp. pretiosum]
MREWHVEDGELLLAGDAVAVDLPASWAAEVSHQLTMAGPLGPILAIRRSGLRWLFLAEPDVDPVGYVLPPGARCWTGPGSVPAGSSRWVVAPRGRALPPLGAVRCAIRTVRRGY